MLLTAVASVAPPANSHDAPVTSDVSAIFAQELDAGTVAAQTFTVHSAQRGQLTSAVAAVSADGPTVTLDPMSDFFAGELVQVTATSGIRSAGGQAVESIVWQFRTGAASGIGTFADSGQTLGFAKWDIALGDLDDDGDLDAYVSGNGKPDEIWLNDGIGMLSDSGQRLGNEPFSNVTLGDVDGDGDLDAFVSNFSSNDRLWTNESGLFSDSGQSWSIPGTARVSLGDLDGDGDLDAFVPAREGRIFVNEEGHFTDTGQRLGNSVTNEVQLGDLDGDGDLDGFAVNPSGANRIWINDGGAAFTDSGQLLGDHYSSAASIGDLDGDGDLDVFVANIGGAPVYPAHANRVWFNDGGKFTESGQALGDHASRSVSLGDLDGDGDLDAFVQNDFNHGHRVWFNESGAFSSGESFGASYGRAASLGDLDGDGDLDVMLRENGAGRVWLNQNPPNQVSLHVGKATIDENEGEATVTATLPEAATQTMTVDLEFSGMATLLDDYTVSATELVIPVGSTSSAITISAVQDRQDEAHETIVVDISGVTNGTEAGTQQVTLTITDDDDPPTVDLSVDAPNITENDGVATATATLSVASGQDVTVDLAAAGNATLMADYTLSATQIVISPGATSGSFTITGMDDATEEPDETVELTITATNATVGEGAQTVTILDDEVPPSFRLSSFTPTSGGFFAELSAVLDTSVLNLGDTLTGGHGLADATLVGATTGPVIGSMVVSPDGRKLEFLATGDRLAADTYTATLRSADNALKDTGGNLLDGDGDGTAGDDFSETFTVATNTAEIGVRDFVRGPGQELNLPANSADGIPITISDGTGIRNVGFAIDYNPGLLNITDVTPGTSMAAGSTVTVDTSTPGRTLVTFTSPTDLPAGPNMLVNLQASVPATNAAAIYGDQHVLDINSIELTNAAGTQLPAIENDGLHVAAFFGDVSGNGSINASDASQVARVAASLDSAFARFLLTDAMIVADISGNGVINATDASMVARHAVELPVDEIPPIPGGVVVAGSGLPNAKQSLVITPAALVVRAPVTIADWRETTQPSTALGFEDAVAVPHRAVDAVLARLENAGATNDEDDLLPALEDAVEQLLSASLTLATD